MTSSRLRLWIALWIVYLVWGSTYFAIKIAVRTLPPLVTAGTRFVAAATILATVLLLLGRRVAVTRGEALAAGGVGVMLLAGGVGLVHVAETRIDSSVAAMIAGSVPLQVVVWRTLAHERVARATVVAAGLGLVGLGLVILPGGLAGGATAVGLAVSFAASLSWSRGSFIASRLTLPRDPFVATTIEMLAGGAALIVLGSVLGEWSDVTRDALQPGPLAAWLYLAVVGSVVGFTAYVWLLDNAPISQVVTHQFVNPLVAVLLGALFLDERPSAATLAGAVLIVGAVVATIRQESRSSRRASLEPVAAPVQGR